MTTGAAKAWHNYPLAQESHAQKSGRSSGRLSAQLAAVRQARRYGLQVAVAEDRHDDEQRAAVRKAWRAFRVQFLAANDDMDQAVRVAYWSAYMDW